MGGGVLPLGRGAVSVFYSPSRLGNNHVCVKRDPFTFQVWS